MVSGCELGLGIGRLVSFGGALRRKEELRRGDLGADAIFFDAGKGDVPAVCTDGGNVGGSSPAWACQVLLRPAVINAAEALASDMARRSCGSGRLGGEQSLLTMRFGFLWFER